MCVPARAGVLDAWVISCLAKLYMYSLLYLYVVRPDIPMVYIVVRGLELLADSQRRRNGKVAASRGGGAIREQPRELSSRHLGCARRRGTYVVLFSRTRRSMRADCGSQLSVSLCAAIPVRTERTSSHSRQYSRRALRPGTLRNLLCNSEWPIVPTPR